MAINKVVHHVYGTLMDISQDTVTADALKKGYTAHGSNGELIEGASDGGIKVVAELPSENLDTSSIYKVYNELNDEYTLYMYLNDKWSKFNGDLKPGIYSEHTYSNMIASWNDLIDNGIIHVNNGVIYTNIDNDTGENESSETLQGFLILPNDGSITALGDFDYDEGSGKVAFAQCYGLTGIVLPDSITEIDDYAFNNCSLIDITIPDSVTRIGSQAFYYAYPYSINFGKDSKLTTIDEYAFDSCGVNELKLPNSVTNIGQGAFNNCFDLWKIDLPHSITIINNNTFESCESLVEVSIPEGVTNIGYAAFRNCSGLSSMVIPSSVENIGDCAFQNCSNLNSVTVLSENPPILESGDVFADCVCLTEIIVPPSLIDAYKAANGWSEYADIIVGIRPDPGLYETGTSNLLYTWDELKENNYISVNDGILAAEDEGLLSGDLVISNEVIGFAYCAFYKCDNLTSVDIPNSVTGISDWAFRSCSGLTTIKIPNSVTGIGEYAFYQCDNVTSVVIGNSLGYISNYAFSYCSKLSSVVIGNSVTSIGNSAFLSCGALTSVTMPKSVTSISNLAFQHCKKLTNVYYAGSESDWAAIAIDTNNSYLTNATITYNYVR